MGRLKWTEYEFFTSSPESFHYALEGYFDERKEDTGLLRLASYRICEHLVGSKHMVSINEFWPIAGEKTERTKIEPLTKEQFDKIIKFHGVKIKNGVRGN